MRERGLHFLHINAVHLHILFNTTHPHISICMCTLLHKLDWFPSMSLFTNESKREIKNEQVSIDINDSINFKCIDNDSSTIHVVSQFTRYVFHIYIRIQGLIMIIHSRLISTFGMFCIILLLLLRLLRARYDIRNYSLTFHCTKKEKKMK